ncbi:MAG TPA: class II aldolase/adducin family protein [Micromonosporaceae bacterium]
MLLAEERAAVVRYARRMVADGLVVGTSGNLSVRAGDLLAVTPSGVDYDEMTPGMVGVCDLSGALVEGPLEPTSELPMHLAVYRHTVHRAVVHTHSTAATAVSTLVDELPSVHYLVALFGGPVRVAPYATYGTRRLADRMLKALSGRTGCMLANHGTVTVGDDLESAYRLSRYLEWLCEVWLRARSAGTPRVLPRGEIERVVRKLITYGQEPPQGAR